MYEIIQQAGLTKNEAKTYLASLELGESSIQTIARKARLHRSVVHIIAEKLIKEGILIENLGHTKRKITPRNPDYLREILRKKQRDLRKKELKLEEFLPKLRQIYRQEKPEYQVTVLDGKKGLHTWVDMVLEEAQTEMLEFVRIEELTKKIDPYLQNHYFPKKFEIGLPTRFLFIDTPYAREYIKNTYLNRPDSAPMACKLVPDTGNITRGYMVIWNDNLSFYSSDETKTTIIRNKNAANHERAFFEIVWNQAGKIYTNRPGANWKEIVKNFENGRKYNK